MAGYTRQSSFSDGDTITAALFNNEYNQLVNAFSNTSGHSHDGTAASGPVIGLIGDAGETSPNNKVLIDTTNNFIEFYVQVSSSSVQQLYIADGAIIPVTDSDVDLGTSSLYFKNAYIDSITTTGNVAVGGNLTVTGTTTFNGGTITMGDAATDNVVFGADVNSNIIPNTDSAFDLGSSTQEWRDLYLDGTAHIDTLDVDVNATIAGTLGVTGVLTGTSLDISGDIDVDGTTNLDVVDIDGAVDMATTLAVAGNVDFNGDLDVDGTTNLDVVDIDGAVDMATTLTVGGEITAASLDISGNVDIDGTLETDALSINSTAVTSTAAELNILDGVTSTAAELNILDGVTSTATELNLLDGVTSTTAELNILDGVTASAADINLIDGITNGTVIASKAIITDANKDITGGRNITISGELDAGSLDISGDADIDGTLEADAITIGGITLAETISDTVGAMVTSNTESGITVAYDDTDNTLDFTVGTLNQDTTGNAATATALATARTIGGTSFDGTANIAVGLADTATALATARTIHGVSFDGTANIDLTEVVQDTVGAMFTSNTESGITVAYQDADGTVDFTIGTLNQDTTGTAATVTGAAQSSITSLGTLTTLTVDNVIVNGTTIGHTDDTDLMSLANGVLTVAGEVSMTTLDIGGTNVTSTAAELNILDGVTSTAAELNILDGVTSTAAELNILDGATVVVSEINALDLGSTAVGTAIASKAVILDSNKDYTGLRNLTITGELDAATLDVSGDVDIDGTLETDNLTIGGQQGSDGQVLTSTGSGVAWEDAAGGSFNPDAAVVFNESSADVDFRVESNNNANMLFVDGGNDLVGIGTGSPTEKLTLNGALAITGALTDDRTSTAAMDFSSGETRFVSYGASGTGGVFSFRTAAGGASSTERMKIHASGCIDLGANTDRSLGTNITTTVTSGSAGSGFWMSTGNSSATSSKIISSTNGSVGDLLINQGSGVNGGSIRFSINDSEKMRINSNNTVGIGTTDASNAKLVINGNVGAGADTACIDFDGYGTYGTDASQSINFRMGRTGQATDQPASIKAIFPGGGATAAATHIGFEINAINANTLFTTARFSGVASRIQFNSDEVPHSNNPVTQAPIVIGPSTSGAITSGLTNSTVLQNRSGELYAIDSSHNNTQITPHNWGLISSGPSEELAWTYYSQRPNPSNSEQLQTINVDMAKVIRKVEDLVGEKLIYTENSDKDGHTFQTIISDIQTSLTNLTTRIEALEG